jgi:hypothetical protein
MLRRAGKSCVCDAGPIVSAIGIGQPPRITKIRCWTRGGETMMRALVGAGALFVALSFGQGAQAQDGLAGLHQWVKVGRKTCMADHFHDGNGSGATRSQAQAAAIRSWADFTAWEYGDQWGRWGLSVSRTMNCSGGPGNFSCSVSSRPCRPY